MTYAYEISAPIAEVLASQNAAIARCKRLESRRLGARLIGPRHPTSGLRNFLLTGHVSSVVWLMST